jgi:hypothetical protein
VNHHIRVRRLTNHETQIGLQIGRQ